jgi:hypothetical protein
MMRAAWAFKSCAAAVEPISSATHASAAIHVFIHSLRLIDVGDEALF